MAEYNIQPINTLPQVSGNDLKNGKVIVVSNNQAKQADVSEIINENILPPATPTTLGGVIVGDGLSVETSGASKGKISVKLATETIAGGIKAKPRTSEDSEIAIDAISGKLFGKSGGTNGIYKADISVIDLKINDYLNLLPTLPYNFYNVQEIVTKTAGVEVSLGLLMLIDNPPNFVGQIFYTRYLLNSDETEISNNTSNEINILYRSSSENFIDEGSWGKWNYLLMKGKIHVTIDDPTLEIPLATDTIRGGIKSYDYGQSLMGSSWFYGTVQEVSELLAVQIPQASSEGRGLVKAIDKTTEDQKVAIDPGTGELLYKSNIQQGLSTVYVNPTTGNDTNTGESSYPVQTLAKAIEISAAVSTINVDVPVGGYNFGNVNINGKTLSLNFAGAGANDVITINGGIWVNNKITISAQNLKIDSILLVAMTNLTFTRNLTISAASNCNFTNGSNIFIHNDFEILGNVNVASCTLQAKNIINQNKITLEGSGVVINGAGILKLPLSQNGGSVPSLAFADTAELYTYFDNPNNIIEHIYSGETIINVEIDDSFGHLILNMSGDVYTMWLYINAEILNGDFVSVTPSLPSSLIKRVGKIENSVPVWSKWTYEIYGDLNIYDFIRDSVEWHNIVKPDLVLMQKSPITKTISTANLQAEIDALPKYLDANVDFTFTDTNNLQTINIDGFYGKGALTIRGNKNNPNIAKIINIRKCHSLVTISYVTVEELNLDVASAAHIQNVDTNNITIKKSIANLTFVTCAGIETENSNVYIGEDTSISKASFTSSQIYIANNAGAIGIIEGNSIIIDDQEGNTADTFLRNKKGVIEVKEVEFDSVSKIHQITPDDFGKYLICDNVDDATVFIGYFNPLNQNNPYVKGLKLFIYRKGDGDVEITGSNSAPVGYLIPKFNIPDGTELKIAHNGLIAMVHIGGNEWNINGDLQEDEETMSKSSMINSLQSFISTQNETMGMILNSMGATLGHYQDILNENGLIQNNETSESESETDETDETELGGEFDLGGGEIGKGGKGA